ncbi:MAG TPA: mechanosensitive ion channel family protein [Gemmatimonadaceae bacterium]|nr:mechanosensitive ion channel family protein [Gemmatimonadaceae bacterium]
MRVGQLLERPWFGNTLGNWAIAAAIFVGTFLLLLILRRLVVGRLSAVAKRTAADLDDMIVEVVRRTRAYFLFAIAIAAALHWLSISDRYDTYASRLIKLVVLVQVGVWGATAIQGFIKRYVARRRTAADLGAVTTMTALGFAASAVLWFILFVMALGVFDFKVTSLVTGLGIGGVAVALAVQNILGDLFAALAIVLDKPFLVGDFIIVDTVMGSVEHIGLKTTRIRSLSGEQVVVSNADLLRSRIRNYKRMYERRVVFSTNFTYDTAPDVMARLPQMIREIVSAQQPVRFDRSHFTSLTDWALSVETVYYVLDPDYNKYMDIQQAINLELLRRCNADGIQFAFPTQSIQVTSNGVRREGEAPVTAGFESTPRPPRSTAP